MSAGAPVPEQGGDGIVLALVVLRWAIAIALSGRAIVVAVRALRQPAMPPKRRATYVAIALVTIAASIALALGSIGRPSEIPPR